MSFTSRLKFKVFFSLQFRTSNIGSHPDAPKWLPQCKENTTVNRSI